MEEYRVRDPVHGFIHFDDIERKIIDSRPFQRLRNIKQLAFCYYVYPGAMHTRFEHSLGVMELATMVFDHFNNENHKDYDKFKSYIEESMTIKEARRLLRLTALLHDIGHLPYSHSGESILPKEGERQLNHVDVSIAIIQDSKVTEIIKKDKNLPDGFIDKIALLLAEEKPTELKLLRQIISGQFDADRIDYLIRDSHYCGVTYGIFDYQRLLETLRLSQDDEGGLELAIERGGVHSLEALILARYFMFAQVYCHRTRRLYDMYLKNFLESWGGIKIESTFLTKVMDYDDCYVWAKIKELEPTNKWAQKIYNRDDHHTLLFETSDHMEEQDQVDVTRARKELQNEFPELDVIQDDDAKGKIHYFYTRTEGERYIQDIKVMVEKNEAISLYKESELLRKIFKRFWCIRVYGYGKEKQIDGARKFLKENIR